MADPSNSIDQLSSSWVWPLKDREPLFPDDIGSFEADRANDVHTGVDLYCELGTEVIACEDGVVVNIPWYSSDLSIKKFVYICT